MAQPPCGEPVRAPGHMGGAAVSGPAGPGSTPRSASSGRRDDAGRRPPGSRRGRATGVVDPRRPATIRRAALADAARGEVGHPGAAPGAAAPPTRRSPCSRPAGGNGGRGHATVERRRDPRRRGRRAGGRAARGTSVNVANRPAWPRSSGAVVGARRRARRRRCPGGRSPHAAVRDLEVAGELERPRVMGEHVRRRPGQERGDVAVDPRPEREVDRAEGLDPRPRIDVEADPALLEERVRRVDRHRRRHRPVRRRVSPHSSSLERLEVLRDVAQVRVAVEVGGDDRAHRLDVRRDVHRDRRIGRRAPGRVVRRRAGRRARNIDGQPMTSTSRNPRPRR